jgi:hypothetical protein
VNIAHKKWIAFIGFGLLSIHILISLLFSFSEVPVHPYGKKIIFRYMFPLFNQNFRVFAPDPPFYQSVMEMRIYKNGKPDGAWMNPGAATLHHFQKKRLTSAYTDYRVYEYHLRMLYDTWLLNDYRANKAMGDSVNALQNEVLRDSLLKKEAMLAYVAAYCLKTGNRQLNKGDEVALRISQIYAQTPEKFSGGKTKAAVLRLNFPSVYVPENYR